MRALLAVLLLAGAAAAAFARAGGGESYSSGSSSSYSSGSSGLGSSSFGSSSSWGSRSSRWDDDGWTRRRRYRRETSTFELVFGLVCFAVFAGAKLLLKWGDWAGRPSAPLRTIRSGVEAQTGLDLERSLAAIKARDPAFDPDGFRVRVSEAFLKVQQAWSEQDLGPVRPFLTDGVFERFNIQLEMQKADGIRNEMNEVRVLEARIVQVELDGAFETVHVLFRASASDRDVSLSDRRVLREGRPDVFEEVWSFLRRRRARSPGGGGLIEGACVACGQKLMSADGARCVVCGAWLQSGGEDWVLSELTQTSEWSVREPAEVPGWDAAAFGDTSPQELEDRASAAFWRWQFALFRGGTGPLVALASRELQLRLKDELRDGREKFRRAAVGAVELAGVEAAGPLRRVHVRVRWSGEAVEGGVPRGTSVRSHVFTLARKGEGASAAPFRSLACPACVEPPASPGTAACHKCGAVYADPARAWVLEGIEPGWTWKAPASARAMRHDHGWAERLSPALAVEVLAAAMSADRRVDPEEAAFLRSYASAHGLSETRVGELLDAAQGGRLRVPTPSSGDEAEAFLKGLIRMCLADGAVSPRELEELSSFAGTLGLDAEQVRLMVQEERAELFEAAKESLLRKGVRS